MKFIETIKNVWKIFGNTSEEALNAIQNKHISKQIKLMNGKFRLLKMPGYIHNFT